MPLLHPTKPSHGDYYLVTHDVASRLQMFRSADLAVPHQNDPMFGNFRDGLHAKLRQSLAGISVHTVHIDDLARNIWNRVERRVGDNWLIASTCPEIARASGREHCILQVNRLFDREGKLIGYGPRPGCLPLREQFDAFAANAYGRPVALLEEGAFSGGTIRFILGELKARDIEVRMLVVGFCTPATRDCIKETFGGRLVVINEIGELLDWIIDRDLIPFTPGGGRVLGEKMLNGYACAFPYILPFGRMEEWASVSKNVAYELSRFCLDASIGFFGGFERTDRKPVTLQHLADSYPAVPIPAVAGIGGEILPLDTEISAFLERVRQGLG
jgi:hypothetical protein